MRKSILFLAFVAVAALMLSGFLNVSDANKLFEKAKYTMQSRGDVVGAIELFKEILAKFPNDRVFGAKSHLYIGLAYEKLGLRESAKSFQAVIDDYPEQIQTVKLAREKLSALKAAADVIESGNGGLVLQQVWANPLDNLGAPSPDGRYLSFINWTVPQLGIYEISTGKITNLPSTTGTWQGTSMWPESSIWSPDGKHLAYVWYDYSKDQNGQSKPIAIRIVGVDGSQPREIFSDEDVGYPHPFQWTNDGKHILASLSKKGGKEIVLISVSDGTVKSLIKWNSSPGTAGLSLSPDGKYLAYTMSPDPDSPQKDIYIVSVGGSDDAVLIKHPAMDFAPIWSPDGENLLFFSNRAGSVGLWVQKVSAGKASGEVRLIKTLNRLKPMGITQDGQLFMSFSEGGTNIYSVTIDPDTATATSSPELAVESNTGWNLAASFSPDGNQMLYVSRRGVLPRLVAWGQESLIFRDLRSGDEREMIPQLKQVVAPGRPPRWSPNGQEILTIGRSKTGENGHQILNVRSSEVETYSHNTSSSNNAVWSKDGKKLFNWRTGAGGIRSNGVFVFDRASGETTILFEQDNIYQLALHPDGNMLAFSTSEAIMLLSTSGGEARELYKKKGRGWDSTITWSPDGRWLYFVKRNTEKDVAEIWRISTDGKDARKIGISFPQMTYLSMHPDGKLLTFTGGSGVNQTVSIWAIKNFLKEN